MISREAQHGGARYPGRDAAAVSAGDRRANSTDGAHNTDGADSTHARTHARAHARARAHSPSQLRKTKKGAQKTQPL